MLTLDGRTISIIPPGPSLGEVECLVDLILSLTEDGLWSREIRQYIRGLQTDAYGRHWESIWSGPGMRRPVQPETAVAVIARLTDAMLARCEAIEGEDGRSVTGRGD